MTPVLHFSAGSISLIPRANLLNPRKKTQLKKCNFSKRPLTPQFNLIQFSNLNSLSNRKSLIPKSAVEADVAVESETDPTETEPISEKTEPAEPSPAGKTRPVRKAVPKLKDEELIPGNTYKGVIRSIQPFGLFVDFGAFSDGLVHISQVSSSFVQDIKALFTVGQEVEVRLLEADKETRRIALSMRDPNDQKSERGRGGGPKRGGGRKPRYSEGDMVFVTVTQVTEEGAMVSMPFGGEAFLPVTEVAEDYGELEVETEIQVWILDVDGGEVTVTMKEEEEKEQLWRSEDDDEGRFRRGRGRKGRFDDEEEEGDGAEEIEDCDDDDYEEEEEEEEEEEGEEGAKVKEIVGEEGEDSVVFQQKGKPVFVNPFMLAFLKKKEYSDNMVAKLETIEYAKSIEAVGLSTGDVESEGLVVSEDTVGVIEEIKTEEESKGEVEEVKKEEDVVGEIEEVKSEEVVEGKIEETKTEEVIEGKIEETKSEEDVVGKIEDVKTEEETKVEEVSAGNVEGVKTEEVSAGNVEGVKTEEVSAGNVEGVKTEEVSAGNVEEVKTEEVSAGNVEEVKTEEVSAGNVEEVKTEEVSVGKTEETETEVASVDSSESSDQGKEIKATISPKLVKQLREETGAGMMDCKNALSATNGDLVKAQEYLRKKGLLSADKKSSRATAEGRIGSYIHDGRIGVLVEVNCETDFVSRGDIFTELVEDLAMQVAACPQVTYLTSEDVPIETVNKEKQIEMQREDLQSKPENIRERIVEGRIKKRLEEFALLEQPFIKNDKMIVNDYVKQTIATIGENIKVKRFVRFNLGEGLEKKSSDFAAEVAAQTAAKNVESPPAPKEETAEATVEKEKAPASTVTISPALVKQLREETGAGMMDCKKALSETGGDITKAQEYLRKKGLSSADKKSSRIAAEGLISAYIHDARIGCLIEVNSETDFVARNEKFKELADDLAMQVVACPQVQYVSIDEIPASLVAKEKEIEMQREDLQSKPEQIRERIVEGRISKRLGELALLEQPFIKDDSITVKELVKRTVASLGENIKVRRFVRFTLGESKE